MPLMSEQNLDDFPHIKQTVSLWKEVEVHTIQLEYKMCDLKTALSDSKTLPEIPDASFNQNVSIHRDQLRSSSFQPLITVNTQC
jgi:hypothetical protein